MTLTAKERLIVALDVPDLSQALSLVDRLQGEVGYFKVGLQLFTAVGPRIVAEIGEKGGQVFLDLKFHDIPNTVMEAGVSATKMGVWMFNVHAAGGLKMMRDVKEQSVRWAEKQGIPAPLVLAVTVLTSMSAAVLTEEMGICRDLSAQVTHWARLAQEAGMDGVVASSQEVLAIREACGADFLLVTPGIRPLWAAKDDQMRIMTPRKALEVGSDYVVIGRPITASADPREAARRIVREMEGEE